MQADGLAAGKGVVVAQTVEEAIEAAEGMLVGGAPLLSFAPCVPAPSALGPALSPAGADASCGMRHKTEPGALWKALVSRTAPPLQSDVNNR